MIIRSLNVKGVLAEGNVYDFPSILRYVDSRGQMSLDIMIAVSILVLTTVFASYTVISAFVPYSVHDIDLQASAYRVAMILSEDGGIWYENGSVSSEWSEKVWQNPRGISEHLKRIGLANSSKLANLSYERCIPCYLNGSKVDTFFNRSLWESVWGENWRDKLAYLSV